MDKSYLRAVRLFFRRTLSRPITYLARLPATRFFWFGSLLIVAVYTISEIWTALFNALAFNGFAADGAFQLFNPMRRLAAGQVIGRDFNFFHGVGVPLLHFPLYILFGQGLFGSELSRWIVSPLLFALVAFGFFYTFRRQWKFAVPAAAIVMAYGLAVIPFFSQPGNSLLGVRASMPVLVLMCIFSYERLQKPLVKNVSWQWLAWTCYFTRYEAFVGISLALSVLCGTEFGVAALLAFLITSIAYPVVQKIPPRQRLISSVRILGIFIATILILLTIIAHGRPFGPLIYAFIAIPSDQSWYFGVPPNTFINLGNVLDLLGRPLIQQIAFMAMVVGGMVWLVHYKLKARVHVQAFICALLIGVFSMVSMLGYFDPSEMYSLERMSLLVGIAAFVLLWETWQRPIKFSLEAVKLKLSCAVTRKLVVQCAGWAFVIIAFTWSGSTLLANQQQYSIVTAVRQLKNRVFGLDTNNLSTTWDNTDSIIMPIIQADNTVDIADITNGAFVHGISTNSAQLIVDPGDHASFIRGGQIVYFQRSGRQIIQKAEKWGTTNDLLVTLQNKEFRLDPTYDGAPKKLIVAQDFKHDNNKLWSLYSTLFEAEMGIFNPSGVDYIIHALGPSERAQYVSDFKKAQPEFVVTMNRSYFIYEEWLQNEHWDLYSLIEQNYEVVAQSPVHILWKRKNQPWLNFNQDVGQWHTISPTIDNSIQHEQFNLPRLSFANVPDVDSYEREYAASERARLQSQGELVTPDLSLDVDHYAQYIAKYTEQTLQHDFADSENSGPETELVKKAADVAWDKKQQKVPKRFLRLPTPKRQVVLIRVHYKITHPLGAVPLLGKTTRYFIEENNVYSKTPVSLRPYADEITFPLIISEDSAFGNAYLVPNTYSLIPGGILHVTSVQWAPLNLSVKKLEVFTATMP